MYILFLDVMDWQFYFQVKFYPPEPTMLQDETTRYQLVLQVRQDVYTGKLPCSWVTQALLGSFLVQSELGDYDLDSQGSGIDYLRQFEFIRNPTDQLLQKIMELHQTHKWAIIDNRKFIDKSSIGFAFSVSNDLLLSLNALCFFPYFPS